jgi:transposase-like protein
MEAIILMYMSERLQVLLDEAEFAEIRRIARRHQMTVAEWVRQALRVARRDEPAAEPRRKLAVVREAAQHAYPTADIQQMLAEIERGRGPLEP